MPFTGGNDVTPNQATEIIKSLYLARNTRLSMLLVGAHGVGKSTLVKQAARDLAESYHRTFVEIGKRQTMLSTLMEIKSNPEKYFVFFDLRLTEVEPQDLMGLPRIVENLTEYAPPAWAFILALPNIEGILFLDELTNVQRTDVLSAAYKLLLDKASGFTAFNPNIMVIAAGNPAPSSGGSRGIAIELPAPLINRVVVIGVLPPTIEDWKNYMDSVVDEDCMKRCLMNKSEEECKEECKKPWAREVYDFLINNRELSWTGGIRQYETYENEPTPRSYSNLAWLIPQLPPNACQTGQLRNIAIGLIGSVAGNAFEKFYCARVSVNIDQIIKNPASALTLPSDQRAKVARELAFRYSHAKTDERQMLFNVMYSIYRASGGTGTGLDMFITFMTELRNIDLTAYSRLLTYLEKADKELFKKVFG